VIGLLPEGLVVVEGALNGVLQQNDDNAGRTQIHMQYSTWYEAALLVGGLGLGIFGSHPDIFEPLLYGGTFGLTSKAGKWAVQQSSSGSGTGTTTTTTSAAALRVINGGGQAMAEVGGGFRAPQIQYGVYKQEPAGVLV
jgi:hypothetical protein